MAPSQPEPRRNDHPFPDHLDQFARWGDEPAFVYPRGYRHERWPYARVSATANQFARELAARNIVKGDAVLIWAPNSAEWVVVFLGCAISGVIAVPVDDASTPDFARRISQSVRTRLVVCPRERAAMFQNDFPTIDPADLSAAISHHPADRFRPVEVLPSDTLEIVFTSGTTAEPKGVVLTHANVAGNIAPIASEIAKYRKYERIVHPLPFLNLLPLSHVFGQFLGIFLPPLLGATVVFENTFNPSEIISTIHRERVSVLVAVPRVVDSLKNKLERDLETEPAFSADFTRSEHQHFLRRWWTFRRIRRRFGWKFLALISGGAALDRSTEEFWHRLGYAVIQGYGLTETTSLISLNHPFHTSRGSIGKVLPGRELRLADDGEILVRGTGVASGYWNGRELVPVTGQFNGEQGWYRTGDIGAQDENGNLFFRGRKKEVIVTPAGMNVYPEDLEAALRGEPGVRDALVIGLERGGNAEPCAVVIPVSKSDGESAVKQAVDRANLSLAEFQKIRHWFVWLGEDFPRTTTGKPRRKAVRDAVAAAKDPNAKHDSDLSAGQAIIATPLSELVARITGRAISTLSPDANLEHDLGLNSLERVELLSALEDRYQMDLSETTFSSVTTVGGLEKLLARAGTPSVGEGSRDGEAPPRISNSPGNEPCGDEALPHPSAIQHSSRAFHYPRWTLHWPATWLRIAAHYLLLRPAVFLLARPRIIGRANLAGVSGPLLVISNHIADVDFAFIQAALPAHIRHRLAIATRGEALEALRSPDSSRPLPLRLYHRLQWFLGVALLDLFPLPREAGFRKSFAYAGSAVDAGYSILVFPEGRHTENGKLRPFRTGIGLLAKNLGVPVLPMRIDGLYEIKRAGKHFAAPGRIQVRIGKPIQFPPDTPPADIARDLQRTVESL